MSQSVLHLYSSRIGSSYDGTNDTVEENTSIVVAREVSFGDQDLDIDIKIINNRTGESLLVALSEGEARHIAMYILSLLKKDLIKLTE